MVTAMEHEPEAIWTTLRRRNNGPEGCGCP
jgi:hypothetical protein